MCHGLAALRLLLPLILVACWGRASTSQIGEQGCVEDKQVDVMAAEFRELRTIQGHYRGGAWNDSVDAWMGRKHRLMTDLGMRLGAQGCSQEQVIALLGAPDQVARAGDVVFEQVGSLAEFEKPLAGAYELLIYEWRGDHDFLYLVCQNETIVGSGWWNAWD